MTPANIAARLGKAIRVRRRRLGLSQEAFAARIEMHAAYYAKIERGEKNVTMITLQRIAAGLRVRMADLMQDAEPK